MKLRSRYSERLSVKAPDTGAAERTKQAFKDECDINRIIKRYNQTGVLDHLKGSSGFYGDFSRDDDYHSSLNKVLAIDETFMKLNPKVRKRFQNDPGQLLDFLNDPKNLEEAVKLGLVDAPEVKNEGTGVDNSNPKGDSGSTGGASQEGQKT